MVCVCRLILLSAVVLLLGVELSRAQHWSHGWYPGGKRDVDTFSSAQVSEREKEKNKEKGRGAVLHDTPASHDLKLIRFLGV